MYKEEEKIQLLLVDDDDAFRAAVRKVLSRRGFEVIEASHGTQALELVDEKVPDIVVLDLKMPELDGISTLQQLRDKRPNLPVIILTGHGDLESAMAGIRLEIAEFLNKPVDIDKLASYLKRLVAEGTTSLSIRERTVTELMGPVDGYCKVYSDQSIKEAIQAQGRAVNARLRQNREQAPHLPLLVFEHDESFAGMIHSQNLLQLAIPPFLKDSHYPSYFTGLFLAQCKLIGRKRIKDLKPDANTIKPHTTLIEAAHHMATQHVRHLPVVDHGLLMGMLRDTELIREMARHMPGLETSYSL